MTKEETFREIRKASRNDTIHLLELYPIINKACEEMQQIIMAKDKLLAKEQKNNIESEKAKSIIIKDIKSRDCNNCKFLKECDLAIDIVNKYYGLTKDRFYCSKWSPINETNSN